MGKNKSINRGFFKSFRDFIIMLGIPIVFLLILELGLRLFNYGYPVQLVLKDSIGKDEVYRYNHKFAWRFFDPSIARSGEHFFFPAKKSENTFRIFVFGASAAFGDPNSDFGFSKSLNLMLKDRYPEINFEIINTAVTAINSNVVRTMVDECTQYDPDLFLIYLGNNEVVGPFGPTAVLTPYIYNSSLLRAGIYLRSTKTWQLVESMLRSISPSPNNSEWGGMAMFLKHQFRQSSPQMKTVYSNFQENLESMVESAADQEIDLLLSQVSVNQSHCAPLMSLHQQELAPENLKLWEKEFQLGKKLFDKGNYKEAVEKLQSALNIDPEYAENHYLLGKCFQYTGSKVEALKYFKSAIDHDALRFRADSKINAIIAEVADDHNAVLVSPDDHLKQYCPDSILGETIFWEHVHFNFLGNYLLAGAFLPEIESTMVKRGIVNSISSKEIVSPNLVAGQLGYTLYDQYLDADAMSRKMSKAPFINRLDNDTQLNKVIAIRDTLKTYLPTYSRGIATQYDQAISFDPNNLATIQNKGSYLSEFLQEYSQASNHFDQVVRRNPFDYKAKLQLGLELAKLGNGKRAIHYMEVAKDQNPYYWQTHNSLGILRLLSKKPDLALEHFLDAFSLNPNSAQIAFNISDVYFKLGKFEQSKAYCQKTLALDANFIKAKNLKNAIAKRQK